jgi:hypothetical protein
MALPARLIFFVPLLLLPPPFLICLAFLFFGLLFISGHQPDDTADQQHAQQEEAYF